MAFLSLIFVVTMLYISLLTASDGLSRSVLSVDIERGCPLFEQNVKWNCTGEGRFRWPCGLRRSSAAALMLESRVRIQLRPWMFVCYECRVLCM
jgi:hypothetical protein